LVEARVTPATLGTSVSSEQIEPARGVIREPERVYGDDVAVAHKLAAAIRGRDSARVRRIILFGSRARGDARPDSDFDLLVVVRDLPRKEILTLRQGLYEVLRGHGVVAEPWVMSETEFEETKTIIGGLAYPAWKEGVILYE
jgi:predicted nucleotidyltransferase